MIKRLFRLFGYYHINDLLKASIVEQKIKKDNLYVLVQEIYKIYFNNGEYRRLDNVLNKIVNLEVNEFVRQLEVNNYEYKTPKETLESIDKDLEYSSEYEKRHKNK